VLPQIFSTSHLPRRLGRVIALPSLSIDLRSPMHQRLPLFTAWLVVASSGLTHGYQWPSPQYDSLESFLWEGGDNRVGNTVSDLVAGCRMRGDPLSSVGAQWLRFVSAFLCMIYTWDWS
jgi:hypothetical protein